MRSDSLSEEEFRTKRNIKNARTRTQLSMWCQFRRNILSPFLG